jgi:hypothetical protein
VKHLKNSFEENLEAYEEYVEYRLTDFQEREKRVTSQLLWVLVFFVLLVSALIYFVYRLFA